MAGKLFFFFWLAAGLSGLVSNQSLSHIFLQQHVPQSLSSNFCISYLICMLCWHWGVSRACKRTGALYSQTLCFCFWALTLRSIQCLKIPKWHGIGGPCFTTRKLIGLREGTCYLFFSFLLGMQWRWRCVFFMSFSLWHGPVWVTKRQKDIGEKDPASSLSSLDTLPETNSLHLKMDGWKTILSFLNGLRVSGSWVWMVDWMIGCFLCDYSVKT